MTEAANLALAALTADVRREMEFLADPSGSWVRPSRHPSGAPVYDVAIVGGGQSGLGAAFALRREGVSNSIVLDENPAGQEGPWDTYARMITLRTPKDLTGVETGLPSLTYRAWHEAQWGRQSWNDLEKIPRGNWMAYLRWFRTTTEVNVRNSSRVASIKRDPSGLFTLAIECDPTPVWARKVVLATGIQGGGEWHVPDFIRDALPPSAYAHTSEAIDFARLKGKRIGILGGGASAFDNAQHALQEGVAEAHVFIRRKRLPQVNVIRHMERTGLVKRYAVLSDAEKYAAIDHYLRLAMPPTNDTFQRARAHSGFHLHTGAGWTAAHLEEGQVIVEAGGASHAFDFLVISTGIRNDLSLRRELAAFLPDIAHWRDRFTPSGQPNPAVDSHPYLGPGFQLTGVDADAQARLHGLFLFNYAALASLGLSASAVSGLRYALPRLVEGVAGQIFLDDRDHILESFYGYDEPEFTSQED